MFMRAPSTTLVPALRKSAPRQEDKLDEREKHANRSIAHRSPMPTSTASMPVQVRVGAFPLIPVALGVAATALAGYFLLKPSSSSTKKSTSSNTDDASAKQNAYDMGHEAGCAQGSDDKKAGASNSPPASSSLTGFAKSSSPTDYYAGFLKGYGDCYASGAVTSYTVSSDKSSGGLSAYDYGCKRGSASGKADGEAGYENSAAYNLTTDGSIQRQKESGNPAEYRRGYTACYTETWAAGSAYYDAEHSLGHAPGTGSFDTTTSGSGGGKRENVRTGQSMARPNLSFRNLAVHGHRVDRLARVAGAVVGGVKDVSHAALQGTVNVGCAAIDEALKMAKTTTGAMYLMGNSISDARNPWLPGDRPVLNSGLGYYNGDMPGDYRWTCGYNLGISDRCAGLSNNASGAPDRCFSSLSAEQRDVVTAGYAAGWRSGVLCSAPVVLRGPAVGIPAYGPAYGWVSMGM